MRTSNAMQLKAMVKNKAKASGVSPQLVLQNYMLERLLERISLSPFRDQIIVKGGVLIGSLIGMEKRTTMDLDTTVKGFTLTHENARELFEKSCSIAIDDNIDFAVLRTEDIRETDDYPGIRVFLKANYPPLSVPLSVDVTTGDRITPVEIEYAYPLLFDDRSIRIMAYPIETVLAEKIETVLSRGIANTRPRDYYDIYMLWRLRRAECSLAVLRTAFDATAEKRGSAHAFEGYRFVIANVRGDAQMTARWEKYSERFSYVRGIGFNDACEAVLEIMSAIGR